MKGTASSNKDSRTLELNVAISLNQMTTKGHTTLFEVVVSV